MSDISDLNDELRRTADPRIGQVLFTRSVSLIPDITLTRIWNAVQSFSDFSEDNDPYDEHDFGIVEVDGEKYNWKIDYYDRADMNYGADDPTDVTTCKRVLTIMHAHEY